MISALRSLRLAILSGVIVAAGASSGSELPEPGKGALRDPTIEDFLNLEEVGLVRPSPDGRSIAIEIRRGRSSNAQHFEEWYGDVRSDIFIVNARDGDIRRLTRGAEEGAGFWSPIWSPDSKKLAVMSNAGGGFSRPAVIDVRSGSIRLLDNRSVNVECNFGALSRRGPGGRIWGVWVNDAQFLTVLLEAGEPDRWKALDNPIAVYGPLWEKTRAGQASVAVWDSKNLAVSGQNSTLTLSDAIKKTTSDLVTGAIRSVTLSPDRQVVAMILAKSPKPQSMEPLASQFEFNAYAVDNRVDTAMGLYSLSKKGRIQWIAGVADLSFGSVRRHPIWAFDGHSLSVPSFSDAIGNAVYRVDSDAMSAVRIPAKSALDAEFLAALYKGTQSAGAGEFPDRVDLSTARTTDDPARTVLGNVLRFKNGRVCLITGKKLILVDAEGRETWSHEIGAASLLSPTSSGLDSYLLQAGGKYFILASDDAGIKEQILTPPVEGAYPLADVPGSKAIIWCDLTDGPTRLWLAGGESGSARQLLTLNRSMRSIKTFHSTAIQYKLPSGQIVTAALLLPDNYVKGKSYPVVIDAYPGQSADPSRPELKFVPGPYTPSAFSHRHAQLLAARGYVVVVPSMPIPRGSTPFEPLSYVADQVESVAEALLRQGIASPGRIGFLGVSYGGYTALSVAARSRTVNAVVAMAPVGANLIDYADYINPVWERDVGGFSVQQALTSMELESSSAWLLRMEGSPDSKLEKYLRNSPRFHLSSKSPPVLLMVGEFDFNSFGPAEGVFQVLSRYGVHVQLARYWGEGHTNGGPGNLRDEWARMDNWFHTHLADPMSVGK